MLTTSHRVRRSAKLRAQGTAPEKRLKPTSKQITLSKLSLHDKPIVLTAITAEKGLYLVLGDGAKKQSTLTGFCVSWSSYTENCARHRTARRPSPVGFAEFATTKLLRFCKERSIAFERVAGVGLVTRGLLEKKERSAKGPGCPQDLELCKALRSSVLAACERVSKKSTRGRQSLDSIDIEADAFTTEYWRLARQEPMEVYTLSASEAVLYAEFTHELGRLRKEKAGTCLIVDAQVYGVSGAKTGSCYTALESQEFGLTLRRDKKGRYSLSALTDAKSKSRTRIFSPPKKLSSIQDHLSSFAVAARFVRSLPSDLLEPLALQIYTRGNASGQPLGQPYSPQHIRQVFGALRSMHGEEMFQSKKGLSSTLASAVCRFILNQKLSDKQRSSVRPSDELNAKACEWKRALAIELGKALLPIRQLPKSGKIVVGGEIGDPLLRDPETKALVLHYAGTTVSESEVQASQLSRWQRDTAFFLR